jgi:hypothetical protein
MRLGNGGCPRSAQRCVSAKGIAIVIVFAVSCLVLFVLVLVPALALFFILFVLLFRTL